MTGNWSKKTALRAYFPRRVTICVLIAAAIGLFLDVAGKTSTNVDRILVEKSRRSMSLLEGRNVVKSYKIALGGNPTGAKDRQGDHKTPEGIYSVDRKKPNSQFHKALHLSYPSTEDRERARKLGVNPGGDIEIHGLGEKWGWVGASHRTVDWTDGCIAVTNEEIEEIYSLVEVGTPVEIKP